MHDTLYFKVKRLERLLTVIFMRTAYALKIDKLVGWLARKISGKGGRN